MISHVTTSSPHLYTTGGSSLPYIPPNHTIPMQGALRLSGSDLEVFDGMTWRLIYLNSSDVGLNTHANDAINWAIKKMEEEKAWKSLAEENQAVKIALDNLEQARRQLDVTAKLARKYEQATS